MKIFKIIILISICFTSCQKVIDLKLNTSSSQIVIKGNIYDQAGPYTVTISKSVNFDESNNFPTVTGAIVIINDNVGNIDTLKETASGTYVTSALQGIPGRTYALTVITNGQTYNASSTMPDAVEIDSTYFEKSMFGNDKQLTIEFKDPANSENYYRIIQYVNDKQQDGFNVTSDKIYEGKTISYSLRSDNKLDVGDKITVWLECVDKGVYEYFRTASSQSETSSSPSNPTSNISNRALGYFNACSIRKISLVMTMN